MKKGKLLSYTLIGLVSVIATSLMFSIAWFTSLSKINTDMSGSLLESYFHCGTGTETDPFVITRPKHWYNLVWLHDKVDDFNDHETKDKDGNVVKGYFFEIGYPLKEEQGDTNLYVYEYSDTGVLTGNYTNVLNCTSLTGLVPLGSSEDPFFGKLEGNGFTVKGMTVLGFNDLNENGTKDTGEEGLSDIGIFGYVNDTGKCSNTYFTDFTVDVTGCDFSQDTTTEHDSFNNNAGTHAATTCNFGYLVGHIADASRFSNVYINRSKLKGDNASNVGKSMYGAYGKVDREDPSSSTKKGYNYDINFNSSAFYNYFNSNWNSGKTLTDSYIQVRNVEDDFYNYYMPAEDKRRPFDGSSDHHAVKRNFEVLGGLGYSYSLNGDYNGTDHQFSFSTSTLGYYFAGGKQTQETQYQVFDVTNSSKTLADINNDYKQTQTTGQLPSYLEVPNSATIWDTNQSDGDDTPPLNQNFNNDQYCFDWDDTNNKWYYYHANNRKDTYTVNFSFVPQSISRRVASKWQNTDIYVTSDADCFLLIDKNRYNVDFTISSQKSGRNHVYTLSVNSFLNVPQLIAGTHHVGFFMQAKCQTTDYPRWNTLYGDIGIRMYEEDFVISPSSTKTINFTFGDSSHKMTNENSSIYNERDVDNFVTYAFEDTAAPYIGPNAYTRKLVGLNPQTNMFEELTTRYASRTEGSETFIDQTVFSYSNGAWYATLKHDYSGSPTSGYIGDEGEVGAYYTAEDIAANGKYNPENLDIVGGGVTFCRDCMTLVAEPYSLLACSTIAPSDADVNAGNVKFSTTKYCSNSIVMYVKNLYASDGSMGQVEFNYNLAVLQYIQITAKEPSFKKGYDADRPSGYTKANAFVDFSVFGTPEDDGDDYTNVTDGDDRSAKVTIRRETIKKASFCGIDKDGYIVAKFDDKGELLAGNEDLVDRFIVCLGTHKTNNSTEVNFNTRITSIRFKFRAEGYGGDFGNVEYRDTVNSTPAVEHTIFTFYFITTGQVDFDITVSYTSSNNTYNVDVSLNGGATSLTVVFYMNDIENYSLVVNGNDVTSTSYSIEVKPPSS